jgi:hypothetical protein
MIIVVQDCQPLAVGGQKLGEDISGASEIPPSGNDA